jgi:8-oxo-dGTP pyrophosphatase MutT (NUDIX family)
MGTNMNNPRTMITFKTGHVKFTYRIGGIAIHNGHALFQQSTLNPGRMFWFLPGGRAELGESAEETLEREMMEEFGLPTTIKRPLFLVENFFKQEHEIGFYFLISFPTDCYLYQSNGPFELGMEEGSNLPMIFTWLPLDQFDHLAIKPDFFRSALQQSLPQHLTHIVNREM